MAIGPAFLSLAKTHTNVQTTSPKGIYLRYYDTARASKSKPEHSSRIRDPSIDGVGSRNDAAQPEKAKHKHSLHEEPRARLPHTGPMCPEYIAMDKCLFHRLDNGYLLMTGTKNAPAVRRAQNQTCERLVRSCKHQDQSNNEKTAFPLTMTASALRTVVS